jgi:hypothetical protein
MVLLTRVVKVQTFFHRISNTFKFSHQVLRIYISFEIQHHVDQLKLIGFCGRGTFTSFWIEQ